MPSHELDHELAPPTELSLNPDDAGSVPIRRRQTLLTSVVVALAVTLAALALYALPILARHNILLARTAGLQPTVDTLAAKLQDATAKEKDNDTLLTALLMDQQDLRDQLGSGALRGKVAPATAGTNESLNALRARVAKLETLRTGDQTHITELQQQLTQVRGQLDVEARDLRAARQQLAGQMDENAAKAVRQLASLSEDQQRDRTDVSRLANNLAVERIGFEVSKGHSTQLAPGVSIGLTKTDVAHRRADGWMWVMPDRRTIWLRGQSAQEPLTFYGASDGRKRELVITQVTRDSVVGYLLQSKHADAGSAGERPAPPSSSDTTN